jgi:hypothetical protein
MRWEQVAFCVKMHLQRERIVLLELELELGIRQQLRVEIREMDRWLM